MRIAKFLAISLLYAATAGFLLTLYAVRCGLGFPDERCVRQVDATAPYLVGALAILYVGYGVWYWRRR